MKDVKGFSMCSRKVVCLVTGHLLGGHCLNLAGILVLCRCRWCRDSSGHVQSTLSNLHIFGNQEQEDPLSSVHHRDTYKRLAFQYLLLQCWSIILMQSLSSTQDHGVGH